MNKDSEKEALTQNDQLNQVNYSKTNNTEDLERQISDRKKKYMKWGLIGIAILVALILIIVIPVTVSKNKHNDDDNPKPTDPPQPTDTPQPTEPPMPTAEPPLAPIEENVMPYEFDEHSVTKTAGYMSGTLRVTQAKKAELTAIRNRRRLLQEQPTDPLKDLKIPSGKNNEFINELQFTFDMIDFEVGRFVLSDANKARYSVPESVVKKPRNDPTKKLEMLGFSLNTEPFGFKFADTRDQNNVYVHNINQTLVFMDKFIQMDLVLPSQKVFGLGERIHSFGLGEGTWTMWASGQDSPIDDGMGRKGAYGVHPFVLVQSGKNKNDYFGMFFRNSNMQSPTIRHTADGKSVFSYISIGGEIEIYFFIHGTAQQVISKYQQVFGQPQLPPFWSLGWQQASWKYLNQSMVEEVIDNYDKNNMPLETVYFDIPYMNKYADFTVDKEAFPDLENFSKKLKEKNQRLVVIIDAAISADDVNNKYYKDGSEKELFIQSAMYKSDKYGKNLIASVWPQKAVFVDWLHQKSYDFLKTGLDDLFEICKFDGLWLDMTEPTTFNNGEIKHEEEPQLQRRVLSDSNRFGWFKSFNLSEVDNAFDTYQLPFVVVGSDPNSGNYDNMTISLNATHPGYKNETEYNLHSLYGHMMAQKAHKYLQEKSDERPFILTRSTFASGGRFTSHWLGDNWRKWEYMRYSIAGMMNMNMFGIPHVGADVCGFFGEKKDNEMCLRWIQLSTFYPLARAHQNLTYQNGESDRSEPYYLDEPYKSMVQTALFDRYTYSRMLYTCLFKVNQNGGSCIEPLFFHYPNDEQTYKDYEAQFIVGGSILVAPLLESKSDANPTYQSYFPQGKWVNLANYKEVVDASKQGRMAEIKAQSKQNAYLREGRIVPLQPNDDKSAKTTTDLFKKPIDIVVNRDSQGYAQGELFLDGGISTKEIEEQKYEYYQISHQVKSFQFLISKGEHGAQPHTVGKLVILNAEDLKEVDSACIKTFNQTQIDLRVIYNADLKTVEFSTNGDQELKFSQIQYVYYSSSKNKDLDLCRPDSFKYKIVDESKVNLTERSTTFEIEHIAKTLPNLWVTIRFVDQGIVNVQWSWGDKTPEGKRRSAPVPQYFVNTTQKTNITYKLEKFVKVEANPFRVEIRSRNFLETEPFFSIEGLLYDSYLNTIQTKLKTLKGDQFTGIFGLGERANKDFFYQDGVYTSWTRDQVTTDENGKPPTKGLYGTHPFYMFRHNTSSWAGVYTNLAQAQDWIIKNDKENGFVKVDVMAVGGPADIYVFIDEQKPEKILERYYSMIGKPVFIPQWSLGWHQCKWGYTKTSDLQESIVKYTANNLPLDGQWIDIDYMDNYKDFTLDQDYFNDLNQFTYKLHEINKKFIPIVDAGVAYRPGQTYFSYDEGIEKNAFLKASNGEVFVGKVWPNEAAFPDFSNPNTTDWWHSQLDLLYYNAAFDGLWLDMNEVSSFCDGPCFEDQRSKDELRKKLPYIPGAQNLEAHTIPLDVVDSQGNMQIDTHSYWGSQEVKATSEWFNKRGKRTMIIERSSFPGMGKYGSRWLGDNEAKPSHMGYSVSGVMLMNMFGIPLAGADICGFMGDTTPELCARWHVLGSFYPFSRNHNDEYKYNPQEPWVFKDMVYEGDITYFDIMEEAIKRKYSLIRYMYTNLFLMSLEGQKPFFKPLFFAFPEDEMAYHNVTYNIMLGDSLKVSINSDTLGQNYTDFYMPAGTWCNVFRPEQKCFESKGEVFNMSTKAYDVYAHLRQGHIIPLQPAEGIFNVQDLKQKPVDFHMLPEMDTDSGNWRAQGVYINDDGQNTEIEGYYNSYSIVAEGKYNKTNATDEKIVIKVYQVKNASSIYEVETHCTDINRNDYMDMVYLYNADKYKKFDTYTVEALDDGQKEGQGTIVGEATYDEKTAQIRFKPTVPLCLGQHLIYVFKGVAKQ